MHLFLLVVLFASAAASAQPADSAATRRPAISSISFGTAVAFRLSEGTELSAPNLLAGHVDYTRSLAAGPLVVQGGLSGASEFFGRDELVEAHVAVGAAGSVGPGLFSLVAGPSLARVRRSERDDPGFAGGRALAVPGLYLAARAVFVVVPKAGFGVEAFAHVNAKLPVVGGRLVFAFGRLPGAAIPNPPPTPRQPRP